MLPSFVSRHPERLTAKLRSMLFSLCIMYRSMRCASLALPALAHLLPSPVPCHRAFRMRSRACQHTFRSHRCVLVSCVALSKAIGFVEMRTGGSGGFNVREFRIHVRRRMIGPLSHRRDECTQSRCRLCSNIGVGSRRCSACFCCIQYQAPMLEVRLTK